MITIAGVALGAVAAGAVLGPLAWRFYRRARLLEAGRAAREREAEQGRRASVLLAAMLEGAGGGYAAWRGGEPAPALSAGLAAALGIPADATLERITAALAAPDRDGFAEAVRRL
ncbi:MAG: hypothetical protein ACT4N4_13855, partial [Rhodospirillales bacterium]